TKAKQAQSRLKELERMQRVAPAHVDSPFCFTFPEPGRASDPLLTLDHAKIGYAEHTVLTDVALTLRPGDRIGLLGKNGAGKSTLLKSITGALPLLEGDRISGAYLRMGYFDQQQLDVLDLEASPLLHLQRLSPTVREQQVLDFLGGFNFKGDQAVTSIRPFSGGEKARLALAMVVWQDPNLLILDEPTNHLDLDMRHALEVALQGYSGALLLVSHDRHLLRNVTEELLLVDSARVNEYPEDIATYERWILSNTVSSAAARDNEPTAIQPADQSATATSRKNQRQESAERRSRLRPLQQQVDKTERALESAQEILAALQAELADPDIYDDARRDDLAELVRREGEAKQTIDSLEQQWLAASEALEVASGSQ
ncbi:MAG: ATP-binding cassette domain-containing protein, partial [Proteobacteria bacterium]|nr:ATP-binding cassette domain-containing protein [Pseudomonadota bacterium]